MKDIYSIIKAPIITEKATLLSTDGNRFAFWVDRKANKGQIKEAVEKVFGVKVTGVNTQRVPGKMRRMGKSAGKTPTRKKAYVTLKEGDRIQLFEGT